MVNFSLAPSVSHRLASFLQSGKVAAPRSAHWQHFSGLNHISVDIDSGTITLTAGAGFDSSYELNFRRRTLSESVAQYWLNIKGMNPDARFSEALSKLWPDTHADDVKAAAHLLRVPMTAHKYLAMHYANLLLPVLPQTSKTTYVEIGPGSGYLAALIHRHRPGRLILIDLPEILPYSFLALHQAFPDTPFMLPNELAGNPIRLPDEGFAFMTADQASQLPDRCMDIGVNTASFGEMLPDLVRRYFTLLRRIVKPDGLFFTCNRVEKWMSSENDPTGSGTEIPVRFDQYPWSLLDRDIFYGKSAFHDLVQPENQMLQRLCRLAPAPATAVSA